jgi:DNA repair exonuclease SbcCD ATPase subunit
VRHIQFKKLYIKNFLSIGKTPVIIDFLPGINVITGINHDKEDSKNGVGKSSIVDALYFALFGSTIRELSKDLIINSFNKEKCEVTLELQISSNGGTNTYIINRSLQPTKCSITKDGVDVTRSTLPKTNEYIQQLVNSTGKIFQNSVVMTINNTVPFMAQSKVDKRKFIESVLNLEVFSEMLLKARDEHNEVKKNYEILFAKNEVVEKNYTANKQQLDQFEENKKNKLDAINKKINDNESKIVELQKQVLNLPDDIDSIISTKLTTLNSELTAIQKRYRDAFAEVTVLNSKINQLKKQLNNLEAEGAVCTTCKRPFPEDDIKHKEQNRLEINEELASLNESKDTTDTIVRVIEDEETFKRNEIKTLEDKKDKINSVKTTNTSLFNKISFLTDTNTELVDSISEVNNENNAALEQTVRTLEAEVTDNKAQIQKYDHELSILECVKFVVSEEGVKSYIVKKILKMLNSRLAYYLNALHANCLCQFDEFFDEQITDEKGEAKSYFNFSGGERKRIDLACLFAFLDIRRMQGDINFNTIFYDELLDSSLDDKGVELVVKILRERLEKYNEGCYIITHRSNAINSKVDSIIHLEKKNGFTYILDSNE